MDYKEYAKEVISLYSISYDEIEFVRHNENMIFKITDKLNNKAYVLRIHRSNIDGLSGVQHTYEGLKSEMEFLHYLSSNKALKIQSPIANCYGEYVTIHRHDEFSTPFYSTLLEWIEGSTLTLKEDNLDEIIFSLGEKVAIFHEASRLFKPTKDFVRPVYSIDSLELAGHDLKYGIEIGLFNSDQYELMKKVIDKVKVKIKTLDEQSNTWGIIHADFQLGNIVINSNEPSFIDFGLFGYGYYLFDLGSAATILNSDLRNTFLQGYASRTTFTFDDIQYIDCLIFADVFISYMLFINDEKHRGWIKEDVNKLCDSLFHKFLDGEVVFYSF
jgi:Ser/Thr protein kinase RdoA (MazF antagonist)